MPWKAALGKGFGSGIGQGLGAAIGGMFGGSKGPSLGKQLQYQFANLYHAPSYMVRGARAAGVHPLYYMGNAPSFSPTIGGQSDTGSAVGAAIGQGVGEAAYHYLTRDQRAKAQGQADMNWQAQQAESMSRTAANFAQAQFYASAGKRAEQGANVQQDHEKAAVDEADRRRALNVLHKENKLPGEPTPGPDQYGDDRRRMVKLLGMDFKVPPGTLSGQETEDLFGDGPASWAINLLRLLNIVDFNMPGPRIQYSPGARSGRPHRGPADPYVGGP